MGQRVLQAGNQGAVLDAGPPAGDARKSGSVRPETITSCCCALGWMAQGPT